MTDDALSEHPFAGFDDLADAMCRDFRRRFRPGSQPGDVAERVVELHDERLLQLSDRAWQAREAVEAVIGNAFEDPLSALDSMLGFTHALPRLLARIPTGEVDPPRAVRYSTALVSVGALAAGHEVSALLRAGLTAGAFARWRTLHEYAVVAAVLSIGNRSTCERFMHHRWILIEKDLRAATDTEGITVHAEAARRKAALLRRYGTEYASTYGWASPLTRRALKVSRPTFAQLEALASDVLAGDRRKTAHHLVHADSLSMLYRLTDDHLLHAGPDPALISDRCIDAIEALHEVNDAVVATWQRSGRASRSLLAIRAINKELAQLLQRDCHMRFRQLDSSE